MAGFLISFTKTFFVPAFIALSLYLFLTYLALPFYRNHYQRYAQYLPLNTISERTSSIWTRTYESIVKFVLPKSWQRSRVADTPADDGASIFDDEEGEGMVGFDVDESRREALAMDTQLSDVQRRLSRDLEEGFRDDSDDEASHIQSRSGR